MRVFKNTQQKAIAAVRALAHGATRAVRRGGRPALSALLAFTMAFGSIPAPAYTEMLEEGARAVALAQAEREDASADKAAGEAGPADGPEDESAVEPEDDTTGVEVPTQGDVPADEDIPAAGAENPDAPSANQPSASSTEGLGELDADMPSAPDTEAPGTPSGGNPENTDGEHADGTGAESHAQSGTDDSGDANVAGIAQPEADDSQGSNPNSSNAESQLAPNVQSEDAPNGENANAAKGDEETALYVAENDLVAATLGGAALGSSKAAERALEGAGAPKEDIEELAGNLLKTQEELPGGVKVLKGDGSEMPVKSIRTSWITKSEAEPHEDKPGQITLRPKSDARQSVRMRVSYVLSGQDAYEPGDITITVPAWIFKAREGKDSYIQKMELAVPAEPSTAAGWNYRRVPEGYAITNTLRMSAATQGFMEFAITGVQPHKVNDMEDSVPFVATIEVKGQNDEVHVVKSNEITARIDTFATLKGVTKNSSDGAVRVSAAEPLVDLARKKFPKADQFIVMSWYMYSNISGNQPCSLSLVDTVQDDYEGVILYDKVLKDYEKNIESHEVSEDGRTLRLNFKTGYHSDGPSEYIKISVAYPAYQFKDRDEYTFKNKVTYALRETDKNPDGSEKPLQELSDEAAETWQNSDPSFVEPLGEFDLSTYGNDNKLLDRPYGPEGAFSTRHGNYDNVSPDIVDSGYGDYDGYYGLYNTALNDLRAGDNVEVSYTLNPACYILPWTYEEPGKEDIPEGVNPHGMIGNYGKKQVDVIVESGDLRVDDQPLDVGKDFTYTSVTLPMAPVIKKAFAIGLDEQGNVNPSLGVDGTVEYADDPNPENIPLIHVQIKTAGSDDWTTCATFDWTSGDEPSVQTFAGARAEGDKILLPEGVTNIRTCTSTKNAGLLYFMRINTTLKGSGAMRQIATDSFDDARNPRVLIDFSSKFEAEQEGSDENLITFAKWDGTNRLMGYTTDVRAKMTKSSPTFDQEADVDKENNRIRVRWTSKVLKQSYITDQVAYEEALTRGELLSEEGGTFYDLLPKGMEPDLSTVQLRSNDTIRSMYTVENYRGTGRTMLVVSAYLTPVATGYKEGGLVYFQDELKLTFDAWYGAEDMSDYGTKFHNVAAYQSDNERIGTVEGYEGEKDDPRGNANYGTGDAFESESDEVLDAMNDLDGKGPDQPNTLYAGCTKTVDPLQQGFSDLSKHVSVDGGNVWGTGVGGDAERNAYAGGEYQYRLRIATSDTSQLKNIMLYDSLENYHPGEDDGEQGGWWRGTFASIDVSQLEALGCDPQVYYSTAATSPEDGLVLSGGDDFNVTENVENTNLDKREVWTPISADDLNGMVPEDKSKITAIAIDASKSKDNGEFILDFEQSASVLVRMHAPAGAAAQGHIDAGNHAFNNVHMASVERGTNDGAWGARKFKRHGYTKVGLKSFDLPVKKEWRDSNNQDGLRPSEVTVQLLANGQPVPGKTLTLTAPDWTGLFEDLSYFNEGGGKIAYSVREDPVPEGYTTGDVRFDGTTITLENRHDPYVRTISGTKTWVNDSEDVRPDRIRVELLANGRVVKTKDVRPNSDGVWSYAFENVPINEQGKPIEYTVREVVGDDSYISEVTPGANGFDLVNTYHPYGNLLVSKTVRDDASAASQKKEFSFEFVFLDGDGAPIFDEFAYEVTGEGIDPGTPRGGMVSTNGTIGLQDGQQVLIKELPEDITYIVTEEGLPGFTVEGAGRMEGVIVPNATAKAEFTNVYAASIDVNVKANKRVVGHELAQYRFMFELVDDADGTVIRRASNGKPEQDHTMDDAGNIVDSAPVVFGSLSYTQFDSDVPHTYTLRERAVDERGYAYSKDVYRVTVAPRDLGNGEMTASVTYVLLGEDGEPLGEPSATPPTFENVYTALGSVSLQVHKTLQGGELRDGQFTFELGEVVTAEDGSAEFVPTGLEAANDANGTVKFADIQFDQRDAGSERLYAIREKEGSEANVVYDRHVTLVQVSIADNHDGTLSISTESDGLFSPCFECGGTGIAVDGSECPVCENGQIASDSSDLEFVNSYIPSGIDIQKTIDSASSADGEGELFEFELELKNTQGVPLEGLTFEGSEYVSVDDSGEQIQAAGQADSETADAPTSSEPIVAKTGTSGKTESPAKGKDGTARNAGAPATMITRALDALGSLFLPAKAYAQDVPSAAFSSWEVIEGDGDWGWTYDDATRTLTIGGNNIQRPEGGSWRWTDEVENKTETVIFEQNSSAGKSLYMMFDGFELLESVDFGNLSTEQVKSISRMFAGTDALGPVDMSVFNASSVTNASSMFIGSAVASVDLSKCKLAPGCLMDGMFNSANRIEEVVFAPDGVAPGGPLSEMFYMCSNLKSVDMSGVDFSQVTSFSEMFAVCSDLQSVSFPQSMDSKSVKSMYKMFKGCSNLSSIDNLSQFDTDSVKNMAESFEDCSMLEELNLSDFSTASVTDMSSMFEGCWRLESLDVSKFSTASVTNMYNMFAGCSSLKSLNISSFDTSRVTSMSGMFSTCSALESLDLSRFKTGSVTSMSSMFSNCASLRRLDLSSFDTSSVRYMGRMFASCKKLYSLDVGTFNTAKVEEMQYMFSGCAELQTLDLGSFTTKAVGDTRCMFKGCSALRTLDISSFDVLNVQNASDMFAECEKLHKVSLPNNAFFKDANGKVMTQLPEPGIGDGWVRLEEDGTVSPTSESLSPSELAEQYPDCGPGTYVWNTFLTFSFDPNGGIGSTATQRADAMEAVELRVPDVVRFGYRITGWDYGMYRFNSRDGKLTIGKSIAEELCKKNDGKPIVLVASWEKSEGVAEQNGVYRFKVPAGYALRLEGIPSGTSYRVRELDKDGWKLVDSDGTTGLISSAHAERPKASFVNTALGEGEVAPVSANIQVMKLLDGMAASPQHNFAFQMSGPQPGAGTNGLWKGSVQNGGAVTFKTLTWERTDLPAQLPVTYSYTISEAPGVSREIAYDRSVITAKVTIDQAENGRLTSNVSYAQGGVPVATPTFRNVTMPGSLSISKVATGGGDPSQKFSFEVRLGTTPFEGEYTVGGSTASAKNGIVLVGAGQTATIANVPARTPYSVREVNVPDGWTPGATPGNAAGVVGAADDVRLEFTNAYSAVGSALISAYKSFPEGGLDTDRFTFALYEGESVGGTPVATVKNGPVDTNKTLLNPDGTESPNPHYGMAPVRFPELEFGTADGMPGEGEHVYTIVEVADPSDAGVSYDKTRYHAMVTVADKGDGTLSTEVTYRKAGETGEGAAEAPVFVNTPNDVGLSITKTVANSFAEGDPNREKAFKFRLWLTDSADAPLGPQAYVVRDASGDVVEDDGTWTPGTGADGESTGVGVIELKAGETALFDSLPYGARYRLEEVEQPGWTNDIASGALAGELTDPENAVELSVANTYDATGTLKLEALKEYDGVLEAGMFTFELIEVEPGGNRVVRQSKENDGNGLVSFNELTYLLSDVGQTFSYQLVERNDGDSGIAYDDAVYEITVTPRDKGDGTLDCEPTVLLDGEKVDKGRIVFRNSRKFELPFTGGAGVGVAGVAIVALGCAAYLIDRRRKAHM